MHKMGGIITHSYIRGNTTVRVLLLFYHSVKTWVHEQKGPRRVGSRGDIGGPALLLSQEVLVVLLLLVLLRRLHYRSYWYTGHLHSKRS